MPPRAEGVFQDGLWGCEPCVSFPPKCTNALQIASVLVQVLVNNLPVVEMRKARKTATLLEAMRSVVRWDACGRGGGRRTYGGDQRPPSWSTAEYAEQWCARHYARSVATSINPVPMATCNAWLAVVWLSRALVEYTPAPPLGMLVWGRLAPHCLTHKWSTKC